MSPTHFVPPHHRTFAVITGHKHALIVLNEHDLVIGAARAAAWTLRRTLTEVTALAARRGATVAPVEPAGPPRETREAIPA